MVTLGDDARPLASGAALVRCLPGRCEGCGLVYEVDLLGQSAGAEVGDCAECGSSVYVLPAGEEAVYLAGFGAGWDAFAAFVASAATGRQLDELTDDSAEWAARLAGVEG